MADEADSRTNTVKTSIRTFKTSAIAKIISRIAGSA
jgi:hypothetical protein